MRENQIKQHKLEKYRSIGGSRSAARAERDKQRRRAKKTEARKQPWKGSKKNLK